MEASDVLSLLLLPQLISLQLKLSYQLDGCHLLPAQRHNLTDIMVTCDIQTFALKLFMDSYDVPRSNLNFCDLLTS